MIAESPKRQMADVVGLSDALAALGGGATATFMAMLDNGMSTALQVIGDSTGNGVDEWVYLLAQSLAADYPGHNVRYRLFNDANQSYDAATDVQAAAAGPRYGRCPGTAGAYFRVGDAMVNRITGDIEVRARVSLDNVTPASDNCFVSKYGAAGNRSWRFFAAQTTGRLAFEWSADGTNLVLKQSTIRPVWANGDVLWVKAVLVVATGQVTFHTSADGSTWTQLGDLPAAAGATSIFAGTAPIEVGGRGGGGSLLTGNIYEVDVRSSSSGHGPSCVPRVPDQWQAMGAVSWGGAPTLDVVNGSVSGAGFAYLDTAGAARREALTPLFGQSLFLISISHNEMATPYTSGMGSLGTMYTDYGYRFGTLMNWALVTQNPRTAPAAAREQHAQRCAAWLSLARLKGWSSIDVYHAFLDDGRAMSLLVNASDGVHPTAAGSVLWRDTVLEALRRRA